MSHPFEHSKAKEFLKRVAHSFRNNTTYIVANSKIIFVCGGPMDQECMMRPKFCEFAKNNLPNFRIFLAENAQTNYFKHISSDYLNVAKFEDAISEISACIVLFPESPGSYAELGYFSKIRKIRKKLLVVNDAKFQSQDSFITLGPIEIVNKFSNFRPTIHISCAEETPFDVVKKRIENRIPSTNRKLYKVKEYSDFTFLDKFYQVFEIIRIFRAMTYDGVEHACQRIWGHVRKKDLYYILSILVEADYVRRVSGEVNFFCINGEISSFLETKYLDEPKLILEIADFYEKHFPEIANIVRGLRQ